MALRWLLILAETCSEEILNDIPIKELYQINMLLYLFFKILKFYILIWKSIGDVNFVIV
jgi:hypothetical protein